MYLLSSNIGEIGLLAGSGLLSLPLPLTAVRILYVDWLIVGGMAIAIVPVLEIAKWMERKGWLGTGE